MPHEKPWLEDFEAQKQAKINAQNERVFEVQRIQNAALKASRLCPFPDRTAQDCEACQNEDCLKARKEQEKLWPELKEKQKIPVSAANTVNMDSNKGQSLPDVKTRNAQELKNSQPHSQNVSGLRKKISIVIRSGSSLRRAA